MSDHHVIIAGFGVPGRAVAELLHFSNISYCVIEKNEATVKRCEKGGERIIFGDAMEPDVLSRAGIDRATIFVVAVPDEKVALTITKVVHATNPSTKIVTRCHYLSAGFEAKALGAVQVVIAERVVADVMRDIVAPLLGS